MSSTVKGNLEINTSHSSITHPNEWWYDLCESESLGIMCAIEYGRNSGAATFRIATSPDGVTWTGRPTALVLDTDELRGICWSEDLSLFVIVMYTTDADAILTSPDGINWTLRTAPVIAGWKSVVWSSQIGIFCAVANTNSGGTVSAVMKSTDGITWSSVTMPTQYTFSSIAASPLTGTLAVTLTEGSNVAIPQNTLMASKDGVTWAQFSPNETEVTFNDCAFSSIDGSLVAIAEIIEPPVLNGIIPSQVYVFIETPVLNDIFSAGAIGAIHEAAWRAVTFSKGLGMFIAMSSLDIRIDDHLQKTSHTACSVDGISWRSIQHDNLDMNQFRSILWSENNSKFIALATQSYQSRNVLIFNTYKVTITLVETILSVDFEVVVFSTLGNRNIIVHRSIRQAGTIDIPCLTSDAVMIAVYPRHGKAWEINKIVSVGEFIVADDTITKPYYYKCTVAGETGVTHPILPVIAGTVVDGGVTWAYEGELSKAEITGPHNPVPV